MVDLPGDGSNANVPGAPSGLYRLWPQFPLEAVRVIARPVFVEIFYCLLAVVIGSCVRGMSSRAGIHQHRF